MNEEWIFDGIVEEAPKAINYFKADIRWPKDLWGGFGQQEERLLQEGIQSDLWYTYTSEKGLWINQALLEGGDISGLHLKMLRALLGFPTYPGWCSRYCGPEELNWYEELYQTNSEGTTKCFLSTSAEIRKKNHVRIFLAKKGCGFALTRSVYPEDMEVLIPFGMTFNVYKDDSGYILVFAEAHPGYIEQEFKWFHPMTKRVADYWEWRKQNEEEKERKIKEAPEYFISDEDLIF